MKRIPTTLAIIALLVMNITSMMHAHTASVGGDGASTVANLDAQEGNGSSGADVDCPRCVCHAGVHATLNGALGNISSVLGGGLVSSNPSYLSQFLSPPFQPPKA